MFVHLIVLQHGFLGFYLFYFNKIIIFILFFYSVFVLLFFKYDTIFLNFFLLFFYINSNKIKINFKIKIKKGTSFDMKLLENALLTELKNDFIIVFIFIFVYY